MTCRKPVPKYSSCPLLPSLEMVTLGLEPVLAVQLLLEVGLSQVQPCEYSSGSPIAVAHLGVYHRLWGEWIGVTSCAASAGFAGAALLRT